jgi:hypothetical protein
MYLNWFSSFINTIVGLFSQALDQAELAMKKFVKHILKYILGMFELFGIMIIWVADLLLSDDEYLGWGLTCAGGGLMAGGTYGMIATGAAVGGPIAAIAGGAFLAIVGVRMLMKRFRRGKAHEYTVRAHIMLNRVDAFLQQWLHDVRQDPFE